MGDQQGLQWHELRNKRLEKDDFTCVNCGGSNSLQVHHIVPKSEGGSDNLSNLRTLCGNCHNTVHSEIHVSFEHTNPAETRWVPTISSVRHLLSNTNHPLDRLVVLALAKTGIGVTELAELQLQDVYLRPSIPDLNDKISILKPQQHPFALVEANEVGPGHGYSKRLCDTKIPLDNELQSEIKKYLAIRPDSHNEQLLLSTDNWGERITGDSIHHKIEKNARECELYQEKKQVGENMTPQRLIQFFKYRFGGQPATKQYLTGRKEKLPYPWSTLVTDYREGIFDLCK